ncbi:hypothetical protein F5144DRAFT_558911 [Chaetomium tenue]|uniref:Uncharacterized protein n=1 Tax=Chaetomium tenue TaxID=1854479 RepID=A0ACB7PRX3_9PEZI|nr:hypothetical protein F5144DRAFT_558911 [Chaetomium globosum]
MSEYYDQDGAEQALLDTSGIIQKFNDLIGKKVAGLITQSEALIYMEFTLVSLAETRHVTLMSKSMKRLTWISLIFLPLTYVSSLFGMNVDILEPQPPFYYYFPSALVTMVMVLGIWILFKRDETLENKLEKKFAWLVEHKNRENEEDAGTA